MSTDRLSRIQTRLSEVDAEALFLTRLPDIRWACGFTGSNALLLVGGQEVHFITDGRYTDQANQEVSGAQIHVTRSGLLSHLKEHGLLEPYEQIAFQAEDLTVSQHDTLREHHPEVSWIPSVQVLSRLVASKESSEIERIRGSQTITETVFDEVLDLLAPGISEREVAAEITYRHLKYGADTMAFPPIVASGPHAAQPHARPTDRELRDGDVVVLDMGCVRDGYASDMTRTISIGEPRSDVQTAYAVVRKAQQQAINAARAGMTGQALDAEARTVIEDAGLGDYFSHSLGHGIGLEVHEWPRVSHRTEEELPEGCCVTIEPGVYLPDEGYGIRIEDIVVLQDDGSETLTQSRKDFITV